MRETSTPVLPFASFLGDKRRERRWDGISFCEVVDRADQDIPRHTHADAHFLLLLRGTYVTEARGTERVCTPSTLLFAPQWTTHRDHFRTRGGSFFTISIPAATLERIGGSEHLSGAVAERLPGECRALAWRIYAEFENSDEFSPIVMAGLTLEMLGLAARSAAPATVQAPGWLRRAVEQLEEAHERRTVLELAQAAGVHPLHFARTFRKFLHCLPGEYMRRRRVERATSLLATTRLPLAEVAQRAGFSDQSQLTKAVRRHAGMTPAQLRRVFGR